MNAYLIDEDKEVIVISHANKDLCNSSSNFILLDLIYTGSYSPPPPNLLKPKPVSPIIPKFFDDTNNVFNV